MKKIVFALVTIAALAMVSCKKDNSSPSPVPPPPGTKQLTKITKTEEGKITVYNFLYDGSKLLTSFKSTDNKTGIVFSYDGNGNLTKAEETEDDIKNVYTYTYTNNLPVSGTFKSWEVAGGQAGDLTEDDQLTYTLTNNQVSKIHVKFLLADEEADFALDYAANGNLSKITGANGAYTASFTYGTKKPVLPVVSKYILDQAGFSLQFAAKNDLLTMSFDFPGTNLDQQITNQYTYDANGYVLTSNDGSTQIKFDYK